MVIPRVSIQKCCWHDFWFYSQYLLLIHVPLVRCQSMFHSSGGHHRILDHGSGSHRGGRHLLWRLQRWRMGRFMAYFIRSVIFVLCAVSVYHSLLYKMNVVWTWIDKHITILLSFCVMRNYGEQIIIFLHNEFQLKQCYSKDCMPGSVANSSFLLHNSPVKTNIICSVVLHFKLPSHSSFVLKGLSTLQWIRILLPFNHKKWEITDWNTVACRADHRSLNPY